MRVGLSLLLVVTVGAALAGFVLQRMRESQTDDGGGSEKSLRRFFELSLLLIAGGFAAAGLSLLVAAAMPGTDFETADLAQGLAYSIVGIPAAIALGLVVRRRFQDAEERGAFGWVVYLTVALTVSLAVAVISAIASLEWAFGAPGATAGPIGPAIVWSLAWVAHWVVATMTVPLRRLEVHVTLGSAVGVVTAAVGVAGVASVGLASAYRQFMDGSGLGPQDDLLATMGAVAVVGAVVTIWYWVLHQSHAARTAFSRGEVLLVGVLGGVAATVVAAGIMVYEALVWLVGDPSTVVSARHFATFPYLIPVGVVGAVSWWYHRKVLHRDSTEQRTDTDRLYDYLLASAALLTSIIGVTVAIVAGIEMWEGDSTFSGDDANRMLLAATLLLIGIPVWAGVWGGVRRWTAKDPAAEAASPVRRAYLMTVIAFTGLVALIALIAAIATAFDDLLDETAGRATIFNMRVAIALVAASGITAAFHWSVYREDRQVVPGRVKRALRRVYLVGAAGTEIRDRITRDTGAKVGVWATAGPLESIGTEEMLALLAESAHQEVMVVADAPGRFSVFPLESRD